MPKPLLHEVYAISFARNDAPTRGHLMLGTEPDHHDDPMPLEYFVWAIRSPGLDVVVDAGFTAETNGLRPRQLRENPGEALRRLGVDPAEVPIVILSHFHNDHVGDLDAFPAATFVAQRAERDHWNTQASWGDPLSRHTERSDIERLEGLLAEGRVLLVEGPHGVADGIEVHLLGGHTPGTQATVVRTARGPVVLAGDAAHFFEVLDERHPTAVNLDEDAAARAVEVMSALAEGGLVVAGHDPRLFDRFPAVPGLEGRAVRIA